MMLLIVLAAISISATNAAPAIESSRQECDHLLIESDTCIRKAMLFGDSEARFPQTEEEIDKYCILGEQYTQCVRSYGKCLKPFPRQVFSILIRNLKSLMRETCDTRQGKQEFMQHSKCMTKDNMSQLHRLMNKMTIHLNYVHKNTTKDEKIPYMCCSIIIGKEEMDRTVNQMCDAVSHRSGTSSAKTVDYVNRLFNQAVGEAVDIGCGNKYGTEEACRSQIGDKGWNALKDVISDANYQEQETSFLVPVVGITKELDSL